jgi:hypothetical protein
MDNNHLKPPSKKAAKALRSVSEEPTAPTAPAPILTTSKSTAQGNLLDEPLEESKGSNEKKPEEDGITKLKRQSSDLILPSPVVARPNGIEV